MNTIALYGIAAILACTGCFLIIGVIVKHHKLTQANFVKQANTQFEKRKSEAIARLGKYQESRVEHRARAYPIAAKPPKTAQQNGVPLKSCGGGGE